VIHAVPSADEQLAFLRQLQRLLDEGSFVASYKYALLHAIADLCVLKGDDSGAPLPLATKELAVQFVRLYWQQVAPFPGARATDPLKQSTGRQAAVVRVVKEARARYDARLGRVERSDGWPRLVRTVEDTVRKMPLWKLQTIGDERVEFLYEHRERENPRAITLKPGVAYCFRQFYSMIIDMVQGAWTQYIRRTNGHVLGPDRELRYFLFGSDRRDLSAYRDLLDDVQKGRCFYCGGRLRRDVAVDHFVPWRRYPFDLGHNFVLAHPACNGRKGDRLAAVTHLRRWDERNRSELYELPRRFAQAGLPHYWQASRSITWWAYDQVARAGGQVWVKGREMEPLTGEWEGVWRTD
jgi:5-methylcytosine-specific restriction endonuclease McrA